ncbi:MAG TPA: PilC/PilY family type IV pilus protein [Burkholderiaceae bacterium]|nr:PilC/PilY family type IV pilus protein [Burkholderiaceae bacterium]
MLLSLSVEFPTVGVAYRGDNGIYNKSIEYVGYFNPLKCYVYHGGNRNIVDGYFVIAKEADRVTHECGGDAFSGNFMNWAASSAIDMLRYALTGGDRIVDTIDATILQRAFLSEDFYASSTYFPRRVITAGGQTSAPGQITPFNIATLYVVSCRNRILFSDIKATDGNCDTPAFDKTGKLAATDKRLGEFLARVKVCDAAEGSSRTDLCMRYGNHYKPVGEMQRHAHRMRFAAMGYLLDDAATRYGGVLRAPMKYLGTKKFTEPSFVETTNDKPEWDPDTGIFHNNPENPNDRHNTVTASGVINYLNRFGRAGVYKALDPVSELYYEGIRYLQGKQPTPEAIAGMTEPMKDGFPALERWADPVTASCQKSYIVAIADVNTHWDRYVPGNQRTTYNDGDNAHDPVRAIDPGVAEKMPELDIKTWTRKVGDMEADAAGTYMNPAPRPQLANLDVRDTGAGGHGTYYMAGLAYWANTHDIRLDKPTRVKTFAIDIDDGGNGQIDSNTRALPPRDSQLYLAAKYGGFDDKNNDGNPFVTYPEGDQAVAKSSTSEWDANGNGLPANYFLAGQPKALIQSIRNVFSSIANTSGTISGVSASGAKISSDGVFVYQSGFDPSKWSGYLKKRRLILDANGAVKVSSHIEWDAGDVLTGRKGKAALPAPDARHIYTTRADSAQSMAMIEFQWDRLNDLQKAALNASPDDGRNDGLGALRLRYLRGERTLEPAFPGGLFRARDSVLGDIVNSNTAYVGPPAPNVRGSGYQEFREKYEQRAKTVYVGANDGMLHAFAAADGTELFAYIPDALFSRLNKLTGPEYLHQPYMDGALAVSEARVRGKWATVLAAGMGAGAQAVIALDVTDPANFDGGMGALWEFSDRDDPDMGNLVGTPVIAKFKIRVSDGVPVYRYFVVVPSGYNNYRDDGEGRFNAAAPAVLFLLSLDKTASEKWSEGINYYKFRMPIADANLPNALASPALVTGNDDAVRYGYVGDLQGNLWRLSFSGSAPWSDALGPAPHQPLFLAMDADGVRQPITTQPKVVFAPAGGYVVLFGTGKFVEDADAAPGNFRTQSFYAVYDTAGNGYKVAERAQLAQRTLSRDAPDGDDAFRVSGDAYVYGEAADRKRGWYVDFPDSGKTGERSITNALTAYGRIYFNTLIPGSDPCAKGGGRTYALDALYGLPIGGDRTGFLSTVGLLSSPVLFETGAAEVGHRNAIGKRAVKKKYAVFNFGTGGERGTAAPAQGGSGSVTTPAGRFSWREILNWQELRNVTNSK